MERPQADGPTRRQLQANVLAGEIQHRHAGLDPLRKRACEFLWQIRERLRQKQPQVTTAVALFQIGKTILISQSPGKMGQAPPSLGVIRIRDDGTDSAFLVEKICAQVEGRLQRHPEAGLEGNYQSKKREDKVKSSMNRLDETGVIG